MAVAGVGFAAMLPASLALVVNAYPPERRGLPIGVWGAAAFPGLEGRASDRVFSLMAAEHLPDWLGPMSAVVVLAAPQRSNRKRSVILQI